ncbi:beta-ketoacyl synthase N-terminal-like domain-containing protein [Streptomyces sp. DSM 44917]|uniref:Beta-ketoacyl synthase N-terminal-like domain-containing protein n=1 Tax=Streptomyces boetiae TaxID=3075541 RepID=A0ABU2L482_9ACTN|nr:beta-ketoacyl synthase N-terminal-like domain-containing protein [Streptomyces sp. DSM 44917]MDT0306370.1 beta-ketoacyl synthase N-terminal-like domain-containing protein [Streptomyces sp. DSM 44917]
MSGTPDPSELIRRAVVARLGEWYGIAPEEITDERPFAELGLSSRDAVALAAELSVIVGARLPATLLWDSPTLGRLTAGVRELLAAPAEVLAPVRSGTDAPRADRTTPPIAVIGIGCRLPGGVGSPEAFWRLLTGQGDAVGTVPDGRWEPFTPPGAEETVAGISRHGAFLGGIDEIAGFDAEFFGIAPSEAVAMDPQQRMLLEVTRESLDHAAIPAGRLAGSRTGVYVGISGNEYAQLTTADLDRVDGWTPPGAALSIAANRLSYALDLRGPSLAIDTACSSSLVAIHQAVRGLATGEIDAALAAGVNLLLTPALTLGFQRTGALAADGRCKSFDASADGMVRGEGCAVVVLKRLADAERDGDRVLAVVRASAVNSDGRSNGLLAPNAEAQRALLAEAHLGLGPVTPAEVDYVEAHGTGTELGDPIEAAALGGALGRWRDPDRPLLIGSAKTNVGHLESAAGIVGFIKTVLALHHDEIPPQLHFSEPSPYIDFDALGLRVVTDSEPWPRYSGTATAGVSAFGFGGTNAHVVLQEYRPRRPVGRTAARQGEEAPAVVLLDAPNEARLREDAGELSAWLAGPGGRRRPVADLARTVTGRAGRGRHAAAAVARSTPELAEALAALAAGEPHPALVTGRPGAGSAAARGTVWVFSGYGSQWPGMGQRLLAAEPAFAEAVERLEPLLQRHAGLSLTEHLRPEAEFEVPSVVMPVIFGMQVALADLWRSYGLAPSAVVGHSMGEVAAAVVAGALDAETGTRVIATRSRLLDGLSGGAMAVIGLSEEGVRGMAPEPTSVQVAVHSSPEQCVVTGSAEDIERLVARVSAFGGLARPLASARGAGHSPQVEPLLGPFAERLGEIASTAPSCRFYSTVLEDPRAVPAFDTAYWSANLRRPVRFTQAVTAAAADGHRVFVEVSPHPTQLHPLTETLRAAGAEGALVLPTLRRGADDAVAFRSGLATLAVHGASLPPRALHPGARVADVPSPRWRHRRFWAGDAPGSAEAAGPAPPAAARAGMTTAERLRARVAEIMGYAPDSIAMDVPLTDLGLDSLMAARIMSAIADEFGTKLEPRLLLRQGTLAGVAELLDGPEPGPGQAAADRVLPRDAAERLVAHAWQSVTGGETPGAEDPLDLSGDELAARLAVALTEAGGIPVAAGELSPAAPGEPVTVASLADRVRPALEGHGAGPVRTLLTGGSRPAVFLAHPAGGTTAVYRPLVQRLRAAGADRPVFGLERRAELREVPERAAAYAALIRETAPEGGPWVLGGWSYGGLVAQEAARQMEAERPGSVGALVLIDTVLPLPAPRLTPLQEAERRFSAFAGYVERTYGRPLPLPYEQLAEMDDEEQIELVVKALEQAVELPPAVAEHQRTSYLDLRSGERHTPGRFTGRTLLYRATEPAPHTVRDTRYERADEDLGWAELCPDLTVAPLEGAHHLNLLDPPVVDRLADLLAGDLARDVGEG